MTDNARVITRTSAKPDDVVSMPSSFPDAWLMELSLVTRRTNAENTELATLCWLKTHGSITAREIWTILLDFHHIGRNITIDHPDPGNDWLDALDSDMFTVWNNLQTLANGQSVVVTAPADDATYQEHDAWIEARRRHDQQWCHDVINQFEAALRSDSLFADDIAAALPQAVIRRIQTNYHSKWYGSPYSLGAALESRPMSGGECFGLNTGPALLEALAQTTHWAIEACKPTRTQSGYSDSAVRQLDLHWMILRGFVYSLTEARQGKSIAAQLTTLPELQALVVKALSDGVKVLKQANSSGTVWQYSTSSVDQRVQSMPTADLVTALRARVAEEARQQAAMRAMR